MRVPVQAVPSFWFVLHNTNVSIAFDNKLVYTLSKFSRNSQLVIFEDSGHFPFIEERDKFVATVREWVNNLG